MNELHFRLAFVLGPFMFSSLIPTAVYGSLIGEWGTNLCWGSVFGLGWCLAAFATGSLVHDPASTVVGLACGWLLVPVLLHLASGWLWRKTDRRGRRIALGTLSASLALAVPSHVVMGWDAAGVHLPDYTFHASGAY